MKKILCIIVLIVLFKNTYCQLGVNQCYIDFNKDTTFQIIDTVFSKSFNDVVQPSLIYLPIEHSRAFGEYTIPFDSFARLTGLYSIFGNALINQCCKCCPSSECVSDVIFRKINNSNMAKFRINFKLNGDYYKVSKQINGLLIELSSHKIINGEAEITPNKVVFGDFEPGFHIKTTNMLTKEVISDFQISCIVTSSNGIYFIPRNSSRPFKSPNLPILFIKN